MRATEPKQHFWPVMGWVVSVLVLLCLIDAGAGQIICPPNGAQCLAVVYEDSGNGFSKTCLVLQTGDPVLVHGWSHDSIRCVSGWGNCCFPNSTCGTPYNGNFYEVEWNNPDCPKTGDPQKPADMPSTAKVVYFLSGPTPLTYNTCCSPNGNLSTPSP
jgi:hypothetical protein